MAACRPAEQVGTDIAKVGFGATVAASRWLAHKQLCAVTGPSPEEGNRRGWPIAVTSRPTLIVSINNLWWPY